MQASEAGDPFKLKETVDEIREDLNPHPAGQKALNAPKKEELTGVQHRGTLLHEGPCSQPVLAARPPAHRGRGPAACSGRAARPGRRERGGGALVPSPRPKVRFHRA